MHPLWFIVSDNQPESLTFLPERGIYQTRLLLVPFEVPMNGVGIFYARVASDMRDVQSRRHSGALYNSHHRFLSHLIINADLKMI